MSPQEGVDPACSDLHLPSDGECVVFRRSSQGEKKCRGQTDYTFTKLTFFFSFPQQMEESSPQVSSRLQNLKLNNLTPRQLFKPTDNQET